MASLRDQFQHFYSPNEDAVATALRTGLVTPDTNVLLNLYRFQSEAREELFQALERLGDRLWIPHQVALEFHRNRISVIAEHEGFFDKTGDAIAARMNDYLSMVKFFTRRISLPQPIAENLEHGILDAHSAVIDELRNASQANDIHLANSDCDEVLARLETLFSSGVGEPMKPDELETARKEARRRLESKIPPGYMDKAKTDPTGDYILWKQLLKEAATRQLPTILITDDRKDDWYRREHGLTFGARCELREEMSAEAGVTFLVMTTETFLLQAAEYLNAPVSIETVNQAKELPGSLEESSPDTKELYRAGISLGLNMSHHRRLEENLQSITEELDTKETKLAAMLMSGVVQNHDAVGQARHDISRLRMQRDNIRARLMDLEQESEEILAEYKYWEIL
jgi:rRNA-processing protein FCF1/ubiquinone biosynthesis protein UbiJ